MKLKVRRTNYSDIDSIYHLHTLCFIPTDQWYKSAIKPFLDDGIVIVTEENEMIGVLLQGSITPCNKSFNLDNSQSYKQDVFDPVNEVGEEFFNNNLHMKELYGIVMICVHPDYQCKKLGQKLIEKHFKDNNNSVICLNTRKSNNAIHLYKKMGYEHIAYIRNKYFLPTEDSVFMIKVLEKNE